jgi:Uma2 family endonuclease
MLQRIADIRMTADEYEALGRAGLFDPALRLELLEGEIYEMAPIGSSHAGCVAFLNSELMKLTGDRMTLFPQNPLRLSDLSEPQPDIMLLSKRSDFYRKVLPRPSDVALIVEVADSSIALDRRKKLPLYALAGVAEFWIVNLIDEQIELHAEPVGGKFQYSQVFVRGTNVISKTIMGVEIAVDEILG